MKDKLSFPTLQDLGQALNSLFRYKTLCHENSVEWDSDFTEKKKEKTEKSVGSNNRAFSVCYNAWFYFILFSGHDNFSLMAVTLSLRELCTLWNVYSFPLICGAFKMLILAAVTIAILFDSHLHMNISKTLQNEHVQNWIYTVPPKISSLVPFLLMAPLLNSLCQPEI